MIISPEKPNSIIILSRQDPSPSALESIPRNSVVFGWHRPGRRRNTSPALGFLQKKCINLTDLFQANLELDWLLGRQQVLICCLFVFLRREMTPQKIHMWKNTPTKNSPKVMWVLDEMMFWIEKMDDFYTRWTPSPVISWVMEPPLQVWLFRPRKTHLIIVPFIEITLQWIGSVTRRCPSHLKWWR